MGRVIAVSNLKGGIGKTTTVVNVGAGLALKGARVLLVDTDAQGNLAMALGVKPRRTIYEVLVGPIPLAHVLDHLCRRRECVNPRHLEPTTISVNTRRGRAILFKRTTS